jgi:DNA-binding NtrC family response regulator
MRTSKAVLFAGNDRPASSAWSANLSKATFSVVNVASWSEAFRAVAEDDFCAVVVAPALAQDGNLESVERLNKEHPDLPVIVLGTSDNASALRALQAGAVDFVADVDPAETLAAIQRAISRAERIQEMPPRAPLASEAPLRSAAMKDVFSLVDRAARGNATVLIRGESGTGKELIARKLHEQSPRKDKPFVKVHCGALPEQILESELFGYERGAFTGANARKPGRVELAESGTLFLDEIGDISQTVQIKLLRVLQDREYECLGGTKTLRADVRFIAATHRDLEQMVKSSEFREDLYFRLNVVRIQIPPLRDRREDIEPLARHFCRLAGAANGKEATLSDAAVALLEKAPWRGNVRELQNFIERLVVLSDDAELSANDVRNELSHDGSLSSDMETTAELSVIRLETAVRQAERRALEKALRKAKGNRALAARILGVSRRTLFYKLREYGLP